jgi:hypothetical protein
VGAGVSIHVDFTDGQASWTSATDGTDHSKTLNQDSHGTVTLTDSQGHTEQVDFHNIEKITW